MLARQGSSPISSKMASLLHSSPAPVASSPLSKGNSSSASQFQNEWNFVRHLASMESETNLNPEDKVLRLLERQDSNTFVVFGESAEIVSTALFNSTASLVEPFGPEYPAMCVLNNANNSSNQLALLLQEFLLLRDGWRIEIWTWDGLRKVFKCTKRASPGNLEAIEDLLTLFDSSNEQISQQSSSSSASSVSPVIAALIVGTGEGNDTQISLSWCDLSSMRIGFLSFQDNPLLTTLEASLIQLGVRELLIGSSAGSLKDGNLDKVRQITSASEIVLQSLKSSEFFSCDDTKGMEIDLARLVGEDVVRMSEMSPALSKTMRCLFVYLNLLGVDSNIGSFKLVNHNLSDFARLDEAALTSLNIFPKHGDVSKGNNNFSLFGFLDHCKTASGSRTLNQWLRQPLANVQLIENRLDLVEMFVDCCEGRHRLRESVLRGIPDMTKLLKKLLRARSSLQEIIQLYQCVAKLHQIIMELDSNEEFRNHANFHILETSLLGPFRELTRQLSPFVQMIEDTIDFDALARNEYCLRPDFDSELQDISDEKNRVLDEMEPEFRRVCSLMKLEAGKKCKMEHNSVYGHYFRISRLDSARLSQLGNKGKGQEDCGSEDDDGNGIGTENGNGNSSSSYTELATLKSGIYFTTSKLTSLSRRYDSLSQEYLDKQASLVVGLLTASQPFRPVFTVLGTLFSMLDVLLALGHVAGTSVRCFVRPKFIDEGMRLCGARHACVEVQPGVSFIENDVEFDRSTGKVLQFITGPNMGGKSTYIRQTALIAILAQCGSFVPCSSAALPVFDAILVRVGAGDNITRGISTFMAEMLETATILQTATCSSLVVIDELGRGTSTCDGISLSRAISEHLANKVGCFTFFATHFHELTAMATQFPASISNLHVAVREDPTKANEALLLFKVQPGICDRSYGVHVARTVGFPDVVLKMAQWRADLLEGNRPAHLSPEESSFLEGGHVNDSIPSTLQKYFE